MVFPQTMKGLSSGIKPLKDPLYEKAHKIETKLLQELQYLFFSYLYFQNAVSLNMNLEMNRLISESQTRLAPIFIGTETGLLKSQLSDRHKNFIVNPLQRPASRFLSQDHQSSD